MGWTFHPIGSWTEATTDSPATDMAAAMVLPQSYRWHVHGVTALVRNDQVASLAAPPGPPVTGYVAWYDSSRITGQADNTPLASWPDLSVNAKNLTASGTARPTYYSSTAGKTVNGLPAVWFNGTTNVMTAAAFGVPLSQPYTIFGVWTMSAGGTGGGQVWLSCPTTGVFVGMDANGYWAMYAGVGLHGVGSAYDGIAHLQVGVFNGASSTLYFDRAVYAGPGNAGTGALNNVVMSDATEGPWPLKGFVTEIVVYPSALNTTDRQSVENYLRTKWGTP